MRELKSLVPFAAAVAIAMTNAAVAKDPTVWVGVGALPEVVSVSRSNAAYAPGAQLPPGVFLAAYQVKIRNDSKNNLNKFRFEANASVPNGSPAAPFVEAIGVTCTLTPPAGNPGSQSYITCPIGTIRSKQEVNFVVVFRSPASGTTITLKSISHYSEGTKDNPINSSHLDGTAGSDVVTALTTDTSDLIAKEVRTFVPPGGAASFTGPTGIPTPSDPWTTTIIVPRLPASVAYTTAFVDENPTPPAASCVGCRSELTSKLAIPENAPGALVFQGSAGDPDSGWLKAILRRDASTTFRFLPSGGIEQADLSTARIFYLPDGSSEFIEIFNCNSGYGYPTAGRPCIYSRYKYPGDWPEPALRGDWELLILMRENGRMQM